MLFTHLSIHICFLSELKKAIQLTFAKLFKSHITYVGTNKLCIKHYKIIKMYPTIRANLYRL